MLYVFWGSLQNYSQSSVQLELDWNPTRLNIHLCLGRLHVNLAGRQPSVSNVTHLLAAGHIFQRLDISQDVGFGQLQIRNEWQKAAVCEQFNSKGRMRKIRLDWLSPDVFKKILQC